MILLYFFLFFLSSAIIVASLTVSLFILRKLKLCPFSFLIVLDDIGSDFEDVIAENDVFGFKFTAPSMSQVLYGLGLKITWRF